MFLSFREHRIAIELSVTLVLTRATKKHELIVVIVIVTECFLLAAPERRPGIGESHASFSLPLFRRPSGIFLRAYVIYTHLQHYSHCPHLIS